MTRLWLLSVKQRNYTAIPADGSAEFDVVYVFQGDNTVSAHLSQ